MTKYLFKFISQLKKKSQGEGKITDQVEHLGLGVPGSRKTIAQAAAKPRMIKIILGILKSLLFNSWGNTSKNVTYKNVPHAKP